MDPYQILGLGPDADDEAIRRRYLELVRQHAPEHDPQRFAAIRAAYESVQNLDARVRWQLFEQRKRDLFLELIEEILCRTQYQRLSVRTLLLAESPSPSR